MPGQHYKSLQGVRGVAASIVLLMHLCDLAANFSPGLWGTLARYATLWGHAGVDVFFVLSGTIMCLVAGSPRSPRGRVALLRDFAVKRAARLYPVFLVTFAFSAWVWITIQGSPRPTPGDLRDALLLWTSSPLHPVSWTLMWEMRFYLMVALLVLVFGRNMKLGFLAWLGYEAAAMSGLLPFSSFANPIMLEFMYGVAIGLLILKGWTSPAPAATFALGVLGLLAAGFYTGGDATTVGLTRMYVYAVPAALALYGLLSMEARGRTTPVDRIGWLGDISYSLYLWHFPIFLVLHSYWWRACGGGAVCGTGYGVSSVLMTVAVSAASFYGLERPFVRISNALLSSRGRKLPKPSVLPEGSQVAAA
ncbi:acyltransferase [Aureimonas sp. AU4]|uniref:acyltransferase family protein n=1 Tax=Aureimonas sp. AU4 TaxID=1638163 RepID=UPI0007840757|nr:acyltransferase [Aureimonas sp. AU4]